jgi:hypothetical protein
MCNGLVIPIVIFDWTLDKALFSYGAFLGSDAGARLSRAVAVE